MVTPLILTLLFSFSPAPRAQGNGAPTARDPSAIPTPGIIIEDGSMPSSITESRGAPLVEINNEASAEMPVIKQVNATSSSPASPLPSTTTEERGMKRRGLFIGGTFSMDPRIKWDDSEVLIVDGKKSDLLGENEKFKKMFGISLEYAYFLRGVFLSSGIEVWNKAKPKDKDKKEASINPWAFHGNVGLLQRLSWGTDTRQSFLRMFMGVGFARTGHQYDAVGVDFNESYGPLYQFGIGLVRSPLFLDVLFRRIKTGHREHGDIPVEKGQFLTYRKKGKTSLDKAILRLGIFF